jgi:predicted nicotinamide N-methyase
MRGLNSRHREIRRLRRTYRAGCHGNRVWASCWLLIDYLAHTTLPDSRRVMDVGCGWGLAGLYLAKVKGAGLTSVDVDWDVYPYLDLHAKLHQVHTTFLNVDFNELTLPMLAEFDLLIGSDICFWERQVASWQRLILRALTAGVTRIVLADPGRPTFDVLGEYCEQYLGGEQFYWRSAVPYPLHGQIIDINEKNRPAWSAETVSPALGP